MQALMDKRKSYYYFFAIALFIHSAVMILNFKSSFSSQHIADMDKDATPAIKVDFLPQDYKIADQTAVKKKQQIVNSEDSANKSKPKDMSFLSDKDRTFDRQTMAKNVDIFNKAGKGKTTAKASNQGKEDIAPEPKAQPKREMKLSDLGMAMNEPMPKEVVKRAPASVSDVGLENGDPLSKGFSATNDYVEEVALGDFTHLNTVEFKFFGFYHRIRQKLEQFWGRSIQEKAHALFRQGRRVPASQDLITSLKITMNAKGEIVDVKILGASGVKELDDAAIESFNQAGPFPNPPKDLLTNGKAVIEWGFVVKT